MQKGIKSILFILLMLTLWSPFLQGLFSFFRETELKGAYVEPEKPEFAVDSFYSGSFQRKWEAYEDYNFGFRAFLIKLKNSAEFILFRDIDNADIMAGKDDFLFSIGSAERTMRGRYYNGAEKNQNTISDITYMKERLASKGCKLITIIVPSKESVMPEYLPASYEGARYDHSDYEDFIQGYTKNQIPFIDLCRYFQKIKPRSPYSLFTKTGFHWSTYGAAVAQDTILNYIRHFYPQPMNTYSWKGIEWSDTARDADADFEEVMNLLFSLQEPRYAYPVLEIKKDTANKKPKVIIIGDSFFWQIKYQKMLMHIFSEDSQFWYYFKTSFPIGDLPGKDIKEIDVIDELENADFVLLVGSLGTLGEFPFGATEYYRANHAKPKASKFDNTNEIKYFLRASNGKYIYADETTAHTLIAGNEIADQSTVYSIQPLSENQCAIRAPNGRYLSAELAQQNQITANREGIAGWETFELIEIGPSQIAIRASNGRYISIEAKTLQLIAIKDEIGENEKFTLIKSE